MARNTLEAWLPEEKSSEVITRIASTSAVEAVARAMPMNSDTKSFPRTAGMDVEIVPKGSAYGEDDSLNDEITLKARKFGKVVRIAEEDIDDSIADVLAVKKVDWASSYARIFDNATLAVTAAENGNTVPFTSVYKALSTTNAATAYTAGDNIIKTGAGVAVTYDDLSELVGLVEVGDYFDETKTVVIAHPGFKKSFRELRDSAGKPIFGDGNAATDKPDTLFGYPVKWTNGARTSAVATSKPTGSRILVVANSEFLFKGIRSGPESVVIDGKGGASALTDETLLKIRARRGFGLANENAAAILEEVPAV